MAELKDGSSSGNIEAESGDGEFEPTVEMLVNDFDDERTLDEEEALEERENQEDEINNLTKEQNMPIEQLLNLYGAYPPKDDETNERNGDFLETENGNNDDGPDNYEMENENIGEEDVEDADTGASRSSGSDENLNSTDMDKDTKLEIKPERRKKEKPSELVQLYPELDTNGDSSVGATARSLRSGSRQQSEDEDEDGEEGSGEEEEDWRKTIMIGSAYQAQVPEGLQAYGDTPPYENEDRLLWEPGMMTPEKVENYLNTLSKRNKTSQGVGALPLGTHVRDDEYALHLLLQCGYNVEEALRRHKMNPNKPVSQMTLWSEEECRNFENGLKTYGKDFHLIQQNKVRTRSVGELVQFYYLWKKTERHDMFATKTRIEKKKYIVHPGTTDYMDRFLDEGEGVALSSLQPSYHLRGEHTSIHALLYGKCPPGVAPPIPSSTIASATIAFVTAPPSPLPSAPIESKALSNVPRPSITPLLNNNNNNNHKNNFIGQQMSFQQPVPLTTSHTMTVSSFPVSRASTNKLLDSISSAHTTTSTTISSLNVGLTTTSCNISSSSSNSSNISSLSTSRSSSYNSSNNNNNSKPMGRGSKRPLSPHTGRVDLVSSLSQPTLGRSSMVLGGVGVDASGIPKAETLAL
ncbi:Mesoderm induction early response protein 3 [Armadillidium nasatum]|uniref:Mesoderm induction early response protein 3 n=1 Tax=Armadillidium nasatum TaxID=96803 RepID=A0A5N5SK00_9CRUS|nr:Mesoderm induction early response protein 3 [Armadillidium nasatum]